MAPGAGGITDLSDVTAYDSPVLHSSMAICGHPGQIHTNKKETLPEEVARGEQGADGGRRGAREGGVVSVTRTYHTHIQNCQKN